MTEGPAVSVIMTVYNGERYLRPAIDSILNQSLADFEFVIVDDGSCDGTPAILNSAATDPRVRVISAQRLGRARALNLAWTSASGRFIANLDADDLAAPDRLEKQLGFFEQNREIGLLGSAWRIVEEDGAGGRSEGVIHPPRTDSELRRALVRYNPFYHSSLMIPRSVLEAVGGYNVAYRVALDYEIQVRIASRYPVANLPDVLVTQRIHGANYFSSIPALTRYRSVVRIRWAAWHSGSQSLREIPHILNPIGVLRDSFGSLLRQPGMILGGLLTHGEK